MENKTNQELENGLYSYQVYVDTCSTLGHAVEEEMNQMGQEIIDEMNRRTIKVVK